MQSNPKIGLALATLNAMPHLKDAFDSIKKTGYKNLHIFVQDGCSEDGTLEYLETQKKFFKIDILSLKDIGVGQAYARALKRVNGCDFVTIISADEMLKQNFFDIHLKNFKENPNILVIYGSCHLFNPKTKTEHIYKPDLFSLEKILKCETIPTISTCMFNAKLLSEDFFYNENLKTCPDYDFWVRLAFKYSEERFLKISEVLSSARMDEISMSFRPDAYLKMARDKVSALRANLVQNDNLKKLLIHKEDFYFTSIYCWAAEMVYRLEGAKQNYADIVCEAVKEWGKSERIFKLVSKSDELQEWLNDGSREKVFIRDDFPQINEIGHSYSANIDLGKICKNNGSKKRFSFSKNLKFRGGCHDWGYIWIYSFEEDLKINNSIIGVTCYVNINKGQIGLSILNGDEMEEETILNKGKKIEVVFFKIRNSNKKASLCIRNGGIPKSSGSLTKMIIHYSKNI